MTRKRSDGTGVKELWRANEPVPNWERQYGFTQFAMTLNEPDESEWVEGGREGGREGVHGRGKDGKRAGRLDVVREGQRKVLCQYHSTT